MFNKKKEEVTTYIPVFENGYCITLWGKKYAFDLEAIKKLCLISATQKDGEREITEVYGGEGKNDLEMSSKIIREIKTQGNAQTDMIIYDLVKLFVVRLLENSEPIIDTQMDFSTSLAFNTMIKWNLLIEIE